MAEDMAIPSLEAVFFQLCYNILEKFKRKNPIKEDNIQYYIKNIVQSFTEYRFNLINLSDPNYAYSYCYRYGPQSAALVLQKLRLAIGNCEQLQQVLGFIGAPSTGASANPIMNVVNIGAGPGMDMVGFLSAVYGFLRAHKINFTLIEPVPTFHRFEQLIEADLRNSEDGLTSRFLNNLTLTTLFLRASLPCYEHAFIKRMKSADIILVCKLLSIIPFEWKREIFRNIRKYMKDSALLVSIDSPSQNEFMDDGFEPLYEEPYDVPVMATEVFSQVPEFYTKMHGPISEYTKAKIRILKKKKV